MATEAQFLAIATRLEGFGEHLHNEGRRLHVLIGSANVSGGSVGQLVADATGQSAINMATSRTHLGELAALCRQRALACQTYTRRYDAFERSMSSYEQRARNLDPGQYLGSPPYPPRSPGSWATRG